CTEGHAVFFFGARSRLSAGYRRPRHSWSHAREPAATVAPPPAAGRFRNHAPTADARTASHPHSAPAPADVLPTRLHAGGARYRRWIPLPCRPDHASNHSIPPTDRLPAI